MAEKTKTAEMQSSAKRGIKSRIVLDSDNLHWWAKRWLDILEGCVTRQRLVRGRSYAKRGYVLDIDIEPGLVSATVQGTRKTPYQIKLGFETVTDEGRRLMLYRLRERAVFAAKLLIGEMPEEIETVFAEVGIRLFPTIKKIMSFKCSCPSETQPCKHIVAVLLILTEVFDDDPFLMLKLHGLEKESIISFLTAESNEAADIYEDDRNDENVIEDGSEAEILVSEDDDETHEWYGKKPPRFRCPESKETTMPSAIGIMNEFPFWRGAMPFKQTMRPYYDRAVNYAYEIVTGEKRAVVGRPRKLI